MPLGGSGLLTLQVLPQEHGSCFNYLVVYVTDGLMQQMISLNLSCSACLHITAFVLPVCEYWQLVVASHDHLPPMYHPHMVGIHARAALAVSPHVVVLASNNKPR